MFNNMIVKHNNQTLQDLFDEAIKNLPFQYQRTGETQGSLYSSMFIEYAEEIIFKAGELLGITLTAKGLVELNFHPDDEAPSITIASTEFDFKKQLRQNRVDGSILQEHQALMGWYDLNKKTWSLQIDTY